MSTSSDAMDKKNKEKSEGVVEFLRNTREEWDKTTFPSSEDVINTTIIVVISVIFFTVFLYLVDVGWVFLLEQLKTVVNYIA
ncbi:MAG: preprotein translocase subunit SecE [Aridibacter sp.]|nr:preprotein translocase subunit SecE [Acidobacteriota bacterium]